MPEIFTSWTFWYVVGTAIVLIAASLLMGIVLVARGILSEAERALAAGKRIETNTDSIWTLDVALGMLASIRDRTEAIADKVEHLAGAVHEEPEAWEAKR